MATHHDTPAYNPVDVEFAYLRLDQRCHTTDLANGSTLSLLAFGDGDCRLMYTHAGADVHIPLDNAGIAWLREVAGIEHLHAIDQRRA